MALPTQNDPPQGGAQQVSGNADPNGANPAQARSDAGSQGVNADGSPKASDAVSSAIDTGKVTRLEQDNAGMRRLLQNLGVDPESNTADLLRDGVISAEEYLRGRMTQPGDAQATQPPVSQANLGQKLQALKTWIDSGKPVDGQTYREHMATMFDVVENLTQNSDSLSQQLAQRDTETAIATNINAAKSVYSRSDGYTRLPDEVRALADDFLLGAADIAVARMVRERGDTGLVSPQGYSYAAKHASDAFNKIIAAAYKAGQDAATQGIAAGQGGVRPVNAGSGAVSAQIRSKGEFGSVPLAQRVREYQQQSRGQV